VKLSILRRRPSPALVISMIALFVSLSGISYGVATGFIDSREIKNNEIRSLDIRNNQIRTRDLRNNEVRGIDIRNSTVQGRDIALSTVTGEDIKEDTLQKVPSAASADTATSAAGVSTLKLIAQTTVPEGASPITLATHGPLTLSATCKPGAAVGSTDAGLTVRTTEDNSAAGAVPGNIEPDLDAAEPPFEIAALNDDTTPAERSAAVTDAFASAPSGKAFTGQVALYSDATGAGSCKFHGQLALQG
jgi:hypothetical protein